MSARILTLSNKRYRPQSGVYGISLKDLRLAWEVTMIKKAEGGYKVLSEKGKNLGGPYKSKKEAEKRLKQVEYFKHKKS
jgi:hypothetical protein